MMTLVHQREAWSQSRLCQVSSKSSLFYWQVVMPPAETFKSLWEAPSSHYLIGSFQRNSSLLSNPYSCFHCLFFSRQEHPNMLSASIVRHSYPSVRLFAEYLLWIFSVSLKQETLCRRLALFLQGCCQDREIRKRRWCREKTTFLRSRRRNRVLESVMMHYRFEILKKSSV